MCIKLFPYRVTDRQHTVGTTRRFYAAWYSCSQFQHSRSNLACKFFWECRGVFEGDLEILREPKEMIFSILSFKVHANNIVK